MAVTNSCGSIGFSLTLDQEIRPFGLRSILVEPGYFRTGLLSPDAQTSSAAGGAVVYPETRIPDYKEMNDRETAFYKGRDGKQLGDPEKGVQVLVDILEGRYNDKAGVKEIPRFVLLGSDALGAWKSVHAGLMNEVGKWEEVTVSTDGDWDDKN